MWFDNFPFSERYSIGPLVIQPYGFAYLLSFAIGYAWLVRREARRRLRLSAYDVQRLLLYILAAVLLGGRLGFIVSDILDEQSRIYYYADHPLIVFAFWQPGRTSFGGIVAVIVVIAIYSLRRGGRQYFERLGDEVVVALPLSFAMVRMATFVKGSIPGRPCVPVHPWCVHFANFDGLRQPATLIEAVMDISMFPLLIFIYSRSTVSGLTGWCWVLLYGLVRYVAEAWREPGSTLGIFSDGQVAASIMIVWGIIGLVLHFRAAPNESNTLSTPPKV